MTLEELIDKLEAAEKGSDELDEVIQRAIFPPSDWTINIDKARAMVAEGRGHEYVPTGDERRLRADCIASPSVKFGQPYTTSLDASRKLMPDGWWIDLQMHGRFHHVVGEFDAVTVNRDLTDEEEAFDGSLARNCPTPELALCIAALRARLINPSL